jgi:hypothetical protein
MALRPDHIDDFVTLTLARFKQASWTDISTDLQHYVVSRFFKPKTVQEAGGSLIDFKIKVRNMGTAKDTGMFGRDTTKVEDVMVAAQVPWAMQTANWSYDIYEDLFQSSRETIIRTLKIREHSAMTDLAELMERNLWKAPADASDTTQMGIPYWIQMDGVTEPGGGFHGGNPSGFPAGCANVNSNTHTNWRNWTFGYTTINRDDFVVKVKKALAFTDFHPPVAHPSLGFSGENQYELFTTYDVTERLERLAEDRNDRLGSDVARFMGKVTIGGVPIRWVPYLQHNTSNNPIYGINWSVIRPFAKTGCQMRRNKPEKAPGQHTVRNCHIDNWSNYICYDRRRTFGGVQV